MACRIGFSVIFFFICTIASLNNYPEAHLDSGGFHSYSKWTNITLRSKQHARSRSRPKSRFNVSLIRPDPERELKTFKSIYKKREISKNNLGSSGNLNLDISHKGMRFSSIIRSRGRMLGKKTTNYLRRHRRFTDRIYIEELGASVSSMS